jgi:methyl-accepting chemotaxis protein
MLNLKNISIGNRLISLILSINILGIAMLALFIHTRSSALQTASALENANNLAESHAKKVQALLEVPMDAARTLAQIMQLFDNLTPEERRKDYTLMLKGILEANPEFLGVWSCWEPNALDGLDANFVNTEGTDATGRFIPYWNRGSGAIKIEPLVDYDKKGAGDYYQLPLKTGQESIIDPYFYKISGKDVLLTSVVVPIKKDGKVIGVAGIDIEISNLQTLVAGIKPYEAGVAAIFSNSGIIAAHFDGARLGKQMRETERDMTGDHIGRFADSISAGKKFSFVVYSEQMKTDVEIMATPFTVGQSKTPWALAIGIPLNKVLEPVSQMFRYIIAIGLAVIAFISIAVVLIARSIVSPIRRTADMLKDISEGEGDLTKRLEVTSEDEIGEMAIYFNRFVEKIQGIISSIAGNAQTLATSATELTAISTRTARSVKTMTEKTITVAAAAEEASVSTNSVAASMEQTSTNLASVAGATEEMSATIGEAAANSEKARAISAEADTQAAEVTALMKELGQAAQEIGKVTETITAISSQTNLLALNATIEAARAGEAGKGFAVVAGEIKELAKQTAAATEDIKSRIGSVQSSAGNAIADIEKITNVIAQVGLLITNIAATIEEQAVVTRDVAGNIAQASAGVQDANEHIVQTASVSKSMARDIADVNTAAGEVRSGGEMVEVSASQLSTLADQLNSLVGQFKV